MTIPIERKEIKDMIGKIIVFVFVFTMYGSC